MKNQFFNIERTDAGAVTIYLYGEIGDYADVRCAHVAAELMAAAPGARIDLRINSIGGEVYSGIAIYNAIRNSRGDIHIYVDGVAASMAGVIALCGRPVSMSKYARLMLHSVSGGCYGDRKELERCLQEIAALEDSLADIIAKRINIEPEAVKTKYFDGTDHWMTAEEALAGRFVDSIYDADPIDGETPEDIYTIFNNRLRKPEAKPNNTMDLKELKKRARFAACADDNAALVEIDKLEAEAAESASLKTKVTDLETKLQEQEAAIEAAKAAERKALLDAAQRDGRINAANRQTFENILKTSFEDGKAALASLKPRRSVMQDIVLSGSSAESTEWHNKSWDELDRAGRLIELRDSAPEVFKAKFREKFGREPKLCAIKYITNKSTKKMAVQKEIWLSSIVGLLFAQNSFMAKAFNADEYVNQGKTVHIPQAGAPSGVKKNRAELPATVKQRKDSDLTFVLDEYTTDPVHIPHADTVELSYDKRESILRQDKLKLLDEVAKSFIVAWLPTDAECTLKTTGRAVDAHTPSATGKRKAFTADDVLAAMTAFNAADIPQEGRYLLLDAQMYSQLLASLTKTEGMAFLACADAVNGVVGKLHSFNIMLRSAVAAVDADGALVAEAAATDCAAALAWHEQSVCRALGEVKMYSNEDDPTYYGDIYSFLVRAGGRRMRNDGAGVLAIVQDTVE